MFNLGYSVNIFYLSHIPDVCYTSWL